MSDTESIQFNEATESEIPNGFVDGRAVAPGGQRVGAAPLLERPPLRGPPPPMVRKGQFNASAASSTVFVMLDSEAAEESDNTESLQFREVTTMDSPSVRGDVKVVPRSGGVRPANQEFKRPPLHSVPSPTSHRSQGRSSDGTSLKFVACGDADGDANNDDSGSIQFQTEGFSRSVSFKVQSITSMVEGKRAAYGVRGQQPSSLSAADDSVVFVEGSQLSAGKKIDSRREGSNEDTISFVVGGTATVGGEGTSTSEGSLSFVVASADDMTEERPPAAANAAQKQASARLADSPPSDSQSKHVADGGKVAARSKNTSGLRQAESPKEMNKTSPQARGGVSDTAGYGEKDVTGETNAFNVYRVAGRHTLGDRAPDPCGAKEEKSRPRAPTAARRKDANGAREKGDKQTLAGLLPNTAALVPLPFPHPSGQKLSLKAPDIEEMVLQAKLYTEHWRMFNDIQREEVSQLAERIVRIRDGGLNFPTKKDKVGKDERKSGPIRFADLFNGKKLKGDGLLGYSEQQSPKEHRLPSAALLTCRSRSAEKGKSTTDQVGRRRDPKAIETVHIPSPNSRRWSPTRKEKRPRPHGKDTSTNLHVEKVSKEVQHDALAKFAELCGVLWPPSSRNELFFLTGVRLTPKQREEFYESMQLYTVASSKVHMNVYAACEKVTALSAGPKEKRKVRVTRTTLLRKAFTVMDIDKSGVINAALLPSMRRLLEEERQNLQGAVSGRVSPASFLTRSRCERVKLCGKVDAAAPEKKPQSDCGVNAVATLRIYKLVLDVLLPLLSASGLLSFDFTTVGLLVFGTLGLSTVGASPSFLKWRETAQNCFESLVKYPV